MYGCRLNIMCMEIRKSRTKHRPAMWQRNGSSCVLSFSNNGREREMMQAGRRWCCALFDASGAGDFYAVSQKFDMRKMRGGFLFFFWVWINE